MLQEAAAAPGAVTIAGFQTGDIHYFQGRRYYFFRAVDPGQHHKAIVRYADHGAVLLLTIKNSGSGRGDGVIYRCLATVRQADQPTG